MYTSTVQRTRFPLHHKQKLLHRLLETPFKHTFLPQLTLLDRTIHVH